jgi:tetratricopeptide (TPR) repeat protein
MRQVPSDGDPADLLALVFARPREATGRATALLAGTPTDHDASIAHQVIGLAERDFGDLRAAVAHLRRAARLARRTGDTGREADVLASLGIALVHDGRSRAGLSTLKDAVARAEGVAGARVRFRLGGALWVLGRHREALSEVERALPVLRRARDPIWVARALTLRAMIRLALGVVAPAAEDVAEADRLLATTGQEHEWAVAVHNRALVAFRLGDLPSALGHLDEAARRYESLGTPMPELSVHRCAVLLAAGLAPEAREEAETALARLDSAGGQATRRAELLLAAAEAALAAGDRTAAQARANAAARLFAAQRRGWWSAHCRLLWLESIGDATPELVRAAARTAGRLAALGSDDTPRAHLLAGRAALVLGQPATAERHLAAAARARHRGPALARAGGWVAEALRAQAAGQPRRTLDACRHGLAVLAAHRLTLGASELRAHASAHGAELAIVALRTCLRRAESRRMLVWSERWRATALTTPPVRPPDDPELQAQLARYREIASRVEAARADGPVPPALRREQLRAERRIQSRLRALPGTTMPDVDRPLDVGELLAALGDARLVAIVELDGELHVLLCGAGRVRRYAAGTVAGAAREVEYAWSGLHRLAHRAAVRPGETIAALASAGQRLERLVLGPAAEGLGDGPVVVVPPARLHGVPWPLLPALRKRVFSVAPSARSWLRARSMPVPDGGVVAVAGPGLAASAAELSAVADVHERLTILEDEKATVAEVLAALDGCALAHVAAHGTFRADSPLFSSLRMADGPLTAYDLERLHRAPHRLVLPSCDSARLSPAGADELLGLAAALLPLGTAGIVASLTPVDDAATVPAMRLLHERLRAGQSLAQALLAIRRVEYDDPTAQATAWSLIAIGTG